MNEQPEHVKQSTDHRQARDSAGDDRVEELKAAAVQPDMTIWHNGRWLPVMFRRATGDAVMLDFAVPEPGGTAYRIVSPGTLMYRRIAASAPAAYIPNRNCACRGYGSVPEVEEVGNGAYHAHSVPCPDCSPVPAAKGATP